jgi:hypothetical protein
VQLRLRGIALEIEIRSVRTGAVPPHKEVDVADVIRLHHDDHRRRRCIEPLPDLTLPRMRSERVQQDRLPLRRDYKRRHLRLPVEAFAPRRMRLTPEPKTGRHVAELDHPAASLTATIPAASAPVA